MDMLAQMIELTPPWLLIAFGSLGMILLAYTVLIILPQPED